MMNARLWWLARVAAVCALPLVASAEDLEAGFANPPAEARPHTWYHMMNGNVTKEGITRDFEELARAGIGGVQMFDAGCDIPPGGLNFNSPEWFDMFKHADTEARRLGLEICIPNCSGWSSSGGPWNPPSNSMKRVVFSETAVKGPCRFSAALPREKNDHGYYADIATLAFPLPPANCPGAFRDVRIDVTGTTFAMTADKPFKASGFSFDLRHPWTWSSDFTLEVEVSEDGRTFRPLMKETLPLTRSGHAIAGWRFVPFAKPLTARALRGSFTLKQSVNSLKVRLESMMTISGINAKTFGVRLEQPIDRQVAEPDQVVAKDAVRDLTSALAADGTLTWDVPAGEWRILRVGCVSNGRRNHPASKYGVGLEVDKLSADAMDYHFEQYVARICRTLGPRAGDVRSGFNNILVDSYEVGSQNWTQKMAAEFRTRRGYDLTRYLPVFAGYVVGSVEESERFLEDFRRVVADLFAENYAGALTRKCHQYGLVCSIEPYGSCPADNLQYGQYCDIPMGEFWSHAENPYGLGCGNSKYVSSITHVWGKRFCATESFTASPSPGSGRWLTTPFSIKAQGDSAYANGVNRIIYHRFTHQPWADDKYLPGMTMGRWGMHLDRTQTWWEFAKPWFRYQARCQYMLQQGTFCADVLYFAGEEAPNQGGNTDGGSASAAFYSLPKGFTSDTCPTDAMYALKVEDGRVVVPGGVRYRILALPPMDAVSPEMIACVAKLRAAGATVVWQKKPVRAPGLKWGADGDRRVRETADALWSRGILTCTPAEALAKLGVTPDVTVLKTGSAHAGQIEWIHRRTDAADWYFVAMPNRKEVTARVSFRQTGRVPELWDAETGACAPADVWRTADGRTEVEIPFTVCGSKFVVFRRAATGADACASFRVTAVPREDPVVRGNADHTLVIKKALYGIKVPKVVTLDVTEKIAARVRNATIDLPVNNSVAGRDPIFGYVKSLFVTYAYDGEEKTIEVREGNDLTIPSGSGRTRSLPDGEWRDGRFYAVQPLTVTATDAKGNERKLKADPPPAVPVAGVWKVSFPHGFLPNKLAKGPDEAVEFSRLSSWSEHANPGIRYFSGIATYEKTIDAVELPPDARLVLDLGNVKDFVEVTVNGKNLGVLWKPPFRIDITDALQDSHSTSHSLILRLRVANLWANRLIGDDREHAPDCEWVGTVKNGVKEIGIKEIPAWVKAGQPSPTGRSTFTTWKHWDKNDQLLPSGLLGPVYLRTLTPVGL